MRVSSKAMAIIIMITIFGGIGLTMALNLWQTESTKVPARYKEGEFAGQYNPEDIRGSYTFGDINASFDVPVEDLAKAFGVTEKGEPSEFQVKELEEIYEGLGDVEIGTSSVKYFVALYLGIPYTMGEEVFLPEPAAEILKLMGNIDEEQAKYIESHKIDISNAETEGTKSQDSHDAAADSAIKGNTTLGELMGFGISKEDMEKIIGGSIPDKGRPLKDFCLEKGIEFSDIKIKLQQAIDELNQ